ncbi:hypothetical protein ACHAWF_006277, partial [Thalassiosira exigua]
NRLAKERLAKRLEEERARGLPDLEAVRRQAVAFALVEDDRRRVAGEAKSSRGIALGETYGEEESAEGGGGARHSGGRSGGAGAVDLRAEQPGDETAGQRLEEERAAGPADPEAMRRQAAAFQPPVEDDGEKPEAELSEEEWLEEQNRLNDLARERLAKRLEEEQAAGPPDPEVAKRQAVAFASDSSEDDKEEEDGAELEGDVWLEEQNRRTEEHLAKRLEEERVRGPSDPEAARRQRLEEKRAWGLSDPEAARQQAAAFERKAPLSEEDDGLSEEEETERRRADEKQRTRWTKEVNRWKIQFPITAGLNFIFWAWLCIDFSDVGGYFAGRRFGKTKLGAISPVAGKISPNKTVGGVIGGCIFSLVLATLGVWVQKWPYWMVLGPIPGVLLALLGLVGDLTASMLKRDARGTTRGLRRPDS